MAICVATLRVHNCCWGLGHRCAVRVCAILALRWTHLSIYGCSISRLAMVLSHTASLVRLRACSALAAVLTRDCFSVIVPYGIF